MGEGGCMLQRLINTNTGSWSACKAKEKVCGESPVDIVSTILDKEILLYIERESYTYAKQRDEHGFTLATGDLQRFMGILLLSGYHKLLS